MQTNFRLLPVATKARAKNVAHLPVATKARAKKVAHLPVATNALYSRRDNKAVGTML